MSFRTAIVVGASSGIGAALSRRLAAAGTRVAAVARREAELRALGAGVLPYVHDVRDFDAVAPTFARILADLGEIDLVVYNAGIMPKLGPDDYDFAIDRAVIEVNLLGAMAWLDQAALYMAPRGQGTLAGISSVAGDRGRRLHPAYHTSKAGLSTFLESLRNRLSQHGVQVVTVKPGPVDTPMSEGTRQPFLIGVEECVDGVVELLEAGTGVGYVPKKWKPIMLAVQHTPSRIFRRLNL